MKTVNKNLRVDLELVSADQASLTKMQAKLNQWITGGSLIKYKTSIVGDKILFEICRVKGE